MKVIAAAAVVRSTISKNQRSPLLFASVFFALVWLEVINHLAPEWSLNPQYGYGWVVPLLMLYLLWQRWHQRPAPTPLRNRSIPTTIIILLALGFFPIRIIAQANPDWRLVGWTLALGAIAASLSFASLS